MKKFIVALMLFLSFAGVNAQQLSGILDGFVLDRQTSKPLEGADVILLGTKKGDATDKAGYFKIEDIQPGTYEISVQLIGYERYRQKILILSGEPFSPFQGRRA